ncbi:MAG: hypothetical protein WC798_03710 [Candidatus Paceibacterota bacterium]|jgi:hypothetical protein
MTRYFIFAILCLFAGYGLVKARPLIAGPKLFIESPANNTPFPNGMVTVSGKAERTALLTLNGRVMLREENGNFSSTLTLPRGGSILTFVADDRFGKRVTAIRSVFVPF